MKTDWTIRRLHNLKFDMCKECTESLLTDKEKCRCEKKDVFDDAISKLETYSSIREYLQEELFDERE